jgi:hypothetical protein
MATAYYHQAVQRGFDAFGTTGVNRPDVPGFDDPYNLRHGLANP